MLAVCNDFNELWSTEKIEKKSSIYISRKKIRIFHIARMRTETFFFFFSFFFSGAMCYGSCISRWSIKLKVHSTRFRYVCKSLIYLHGNHSTRTILCIVNTISHQPIFISHWNNKRKVHSTRKIQVNSREKIFNVFIQHIRLFSSITRALEAEKNKKKRFFYSRTCIRKIAGFSALIDRILNFRFFPVS